MDVFTRNAVIVGLAGLAKGASMPPAALDRVVRAVARYPGAMQGLFHHIVRAMIAQGDLGTVFDWLRSNIWSQGSRFTTDELALRASGEVLNPAHFKAHLMARYLA